MDLGAPPAAGAAEGLIFSPPFLAPEACWWARTIVESTIRYSNRQVAPRRIRPHDPQHRLQEQAIVAARRAACTVVADDVPRYPFPLVIPQDQTVQNSQG